MFAFTETVNIAAPAEQVWDTMHDLEAWWPASNPEHISLERLDNRGITVGAQLRIRETIAGIPGEAVGVITRVTPGTEVSWQADHARYRWFGLTLTVAEGVTWRVQSDGHRQCQLSAHVWARFPRSPLGHVHSWAFEHLLDGVDKDRRHARTELEYLKHAIENGDR